MQLFGISKHFFIYEYLYKEGVLSRWLLYITWEWRYIVKNKQHFFVVPVHIYCQCLPYNLFFKIHFGVMVLSKVLNEQHFKTNWFGVFKFMICLINMWFLHSNSSYNILYFLHSLILCPVVLKWSLLISFCIFRPAGRYTMQHTLLSVNLEWVVWSIHLKFLLVHMGIFF